MYVWCCIAVSPSRARLQILSEKLVNINHNLEEDKVQKQDTIKQRINAFHDKINQNLAAQDIQFKILKERTEKLYQDIQEERQIRQDLDHEIEK